MFKRNLVEGLKNITRSVWISITAIIVLTVSLASVALIITMSVTLGYAVRNIDRLVSFPAFFKENVVEEQITNTILPRIKSNPNIKNVEYFDKEKAKLAVNTGAVNVVSTTLGTDENYAWRYLLITPNKSENYTELVNFVKDGEFRDTFVEVPADTAAITKLTKFYEWVNVASVVTIIIFSIVAILVMSNILRMTIYNNKEEIEIMRLVGATNAYIQGPFITQGVLYNLVSAILVIIIFVSGIGFIAPTLRSYLGVSSLTNGGSSDLVPQIFFSLGLTMILAIAMGAVTVYFSIQRYLKS
jgi:cell division transport system permease protein